MSRIFFTLAVFSMLLMVATLLVGLQAPDSKEYLQERTELTTRIREIQLSTSPTPQQAAQLAADRMTLAKMDSSHEQARTWQRIHFLMGIGTALTVVLVNCIAVTYFIGTGRWCREVIEVYQLDAALLRESQRLKRRSFPWAVLGVASIMIISALGAASDPGTLRANTDAWATPHLVSAIAGLALIGWAFVSQWGNLLDQQKVIEQLVAQVSEARRRRGLSVE